MHSHLRWCCPQLRVARLNLLRNRVSGRRPTAAHLECKDHSRTRNTRVSPSPRLREAPEGASQHRHNPPSFGLAESPPVFIEHAARNTGQDLCRLWRGQAVTGAGIREATFGGFDQDDKLTQYKSRSRRAPLKYRDVAVGRCAGVASPLEGPVCPTENKCRILNRMEDGFPLFLTRLERSGAFRFPGHHTPSG